MRKKGWLRVAVLVIGFVLIHSAGEAGQPLPSTPTIQSLLKPAVYEQVMKSRDVMTHAKIDGPSYSFYAAMKVQASVERTRAVLTNYELYSKLISYVKKTAYDPSTQTLEIVGSFMGWTMHSWVKFEDRSPNWIHYTFVRGHFAGMSGDMYFESFMPPRGSAGSLVYLAGGLSQSKWPPIPKMILEWGAEIVFGFTGGHMRSYIESYDQKSSSP
jgi:hypothetical protein